MIALSALRCCVVVAYATLPYLANEAVAAIYLYNREHIHVPIAVAARFRACTVFDRSNTGIVGSNPTKGVDACVRLFCVCVVLCVGSGLAAG
jgi:hypothetical protein